MLCVNFETEILFDFFNDKQILLNLIGPITIFELDKLAELQITLIWKWLSSSIKSRGHCSYM